MPNSPLTRRPVIGPNPPITHIMGQLYLGDSIASRDPTILKVNKISAVVTLCADGWSHWRTDWYKEIIPEGNQLWFRCNDSMTQDLLPELGNICTFIKDHLEHGAVLVHCDRGISRSSTGMIAYLMQTNGFDLDAAMTLVKEKRKIRPNPNFMEQLEVWAAVKGDIWESPGVPKAEYAEFLKKRKERLDEAGLTGNEPVGVQDLSDH